MRSRSHCGLQRRAALSGVVVGAFVVACTNDNVNGRKPEGTDGGDDAVQVPTLSAPELVGPLAGPEAPPIAGLEFFGTDLGSTFVHQGRHTILFGDTMAYAKFYCDNHDPMQDDALATLPLSPPSGVPPLGFATTPGDPSAYATVHLFRDGALLPTGLGATPSTGFSDGQHAFAMIGHKELTSCRRDGTSAPDCDSKAGLTCTHEVGNCMPLVNDIPTLCDTATGEGCVLGQQCVASDDGYCVDLTSSKYDGTSRSLRFVVAKNTELAVEHDDDPAVFDSAFSFASTKFTGVIARTVSRLSDERRGDDFSPGTGALLMWGRPGFSGEYAHQSELYLLEHPLPLPVRSDGTVAFEPRYFAGVDPESGEPRWSDMQRDAVPIAMDGKRNGSPSEPLILVNQSTISWLGPPVNKWMMLYGGDVPDGLLLDPSSANAQGTRGPVRARFADWPWGPFSPAQVHLSPGSPGARGDPYGPGGFLYHVDCVDQPDAPCARTDPVRPADTLVPGCPAPFLQLDIGRLYGANIIDAYTQADPEGGLDVTWNVSTWNPYGVVVMRTRVTAP